MGGLGLLMRRRAIQAHPAAGVDKYKFKDALVEEILMANGVSSNGEYITRDDIAKVSNIGTWFKGSAITSFDELDDFVNVTSLSANAFNGCPNLVSVGTQNIITLGDQVFYGSNNIQQLILPNVKTIGTYQMRYNSALNFLDIGANCSWIATRGFSDCPNVAAIICRNVNPPGLDYNTSLATNSCPIYVPDEAVETYKTASVWSSYASRIKPLSEYQG